MLPTVRFTQAFFAIIFEALFLENLLELINRHHFPPVGNPDGGGGKGGRLGG